VSAEVVLRNEVGLHARPAALLARSIADLRAEVRIRYGGREADARSVLALMELGAGGAALAEVTASGEDAAEAVRRVADLANNAFNE
jgi:PTS hybrid protein